MVSCGGTRLHRLTFSKTVADFVASYGDYEVHRFRIKRGRRLEKGETSQTGIYLTCTAKCGSPLRATLIKGIADIHYDEDSRVTYEAHLTGS